MPRGTPSPPNLRTSTGTCVVEEQPTGLARGIEALAWAIVLIGIAARIVRYAANRSLWRDEGALAVNLLDRSFGELARPLDHLQAAPLGFLFLEKTVMSVLGSGEYALRLVPLLAGVASVGAFWRVSRELLPRRDALLALLLFSASEPLIFYASELKPYATDVLVCLLVLWPAAAIARRGATVPRVLALAVSGSLGLWLSYPAAFVCAGVAAAGLAGGGSRAAVPRGAVFGVTAVWAASFAAAYAWWLRPVEGNPLLRNFWSDAFAPPPFSADALKWYWDTLFAVFNDPVGLPAKEIALFAFLVGLVSLARRRRFAVLLLLAPVAAALLASMLGLAPFPTSARHSLSERHYPFTGRVILFCVPLLLPFVACGVGWFLRHPDRRVRSAGWLVGTLLLAAPLQQLFVNLASPPLLQELRPVFDRLAERAEPSDRIYTQRVTEAVVSYYAQRTGLRGLVRVLQPRSRDGLPPPLASLEPGDRFWFVALRHSSWKRAAAERERTTAWIERLAEPIESVEEPGASATLYRAERSVETWLEDRGSR